MQKKEQTKRKILQWIMGSFLVFLLSFGLIYPLLGLIIFAMMISFLAVSLFKGRLWCGWMCPRGGFLDRFLAPISLKRPSPSLFRKMKFRIAVVIIMMSFFVFQLWLTNGNLYSIGAVFIRMCIITSIIAFPLAIIYRPRTWCSFCPMGTIQGFLGRRKYAIKFTNKESCSNCKLCQKSCPANIDPTDYKDTQIDTMHCIKCKNCVLSCPKKTLSI